MRRLTAFLGALLLASPALADTTTISAAPWVDFLKPYIDVIVQSAITLIFAYIAYLVQRYFGIVIPAALTERLKAAASTEAGSIVAGAEASISSKSFAVGSPAVAAAAERIAARLPDTAKAVGATPEVLQHFVTGEIGKLQAAMPQPVVAAL